ncbi:MAG: DNA-binding response regulator [Proteobacteria bacterium]|nr:MAG: DNA-binding response regulator [Pseudomonadota bacterium]
MAQKTILIIEDEKDILELLEYTLQKQGYKTIGFLNIGEHLLDILDEKNVDLILMDRNLPSSDGVKFISKIKKLGYPQAVIYLSAKDKDEDILKGFECYGDDYITKPFKIPELNARIKAVLKRSLGEFEVLKVRDILYDGKKKVFRIGGEDLHLSHLEHDLLLEFMKNKDRLLSREHLLYNVWKDAFLVQEKSVNVAIKRLKQKIDPHNEKGYIKAIRGEGYMFC